jgi:hypothetical protein
MAQRGPIGVENPSNGNGHIYTSPQDETSPSESLSGESLSGEVPTGESASTETPPGSSRRARTERENAFDVGAWLLQGLAGFSEELRHNDLGLPEDFWVHAYAARKEALLAARALVDAALENCAEEKATQSGRKKKPPQRGQVSIDFG